MPARPPIALADLIKALAVLAPETDAARAAVRDALGIKWRLTGDDLAPEPEKTQPAVVNPTKELAHPTPSAPSPSASILPTVSSRPEVAADKPRERLVLQPPLPSSLPQLEPSSLTPSSHFIPWHGVPPPLFAPRWERQCLLALAARQEAGTRLDIQRLTNTIARGRPVTGLPLCRDASLRNGVHILVDHARGMDYFAADTDHFVERIIRLLGAHRVSTWRFKTIPDTADPRFAADQPPTPLPPVGVPVIVLGGLALGEGLVRTRRGWRRFLSTARNHRVVLVTPLTETVIRPELPPDLPIVTWDRTTSDRDIHRLLGGMEW